ncbi:zinc ribbon domain-containing protein [Candidatus Pacearchaeota archaeon]|nr:zinc ribbon domain-containing protein [Candidatus Pacearchaeota archaeon]
MGSNLDLRKYQKEEEIQDAFSKLVSNRPGYKAVLEKKEPKFCPNESCKKEVEHHLKFCPACGTKIESKNKASICMKCYNIVNAGDLFCGSCGSKVETAQ